MLIVAMVAVVFFAYLALMVGRMLDESGELSEGQSRLIARLKPLQTWHFLAVMALAFVLAFSGSFALPLLAGVALVAYALAWIREFVFLMGLRDDDFPGRFDKPIWAFVLVATGPIGLWAFRSFRAACWSPLVGVDETAHRQSAKPSPSPDLA